jgi:hypothetical protein
VNNLIEVKKNLTTKSALVIIWHRIVRIVSHTILLVIFTFLLVILHPCNKTKMPCVTVREKPFGLFILYRRRQLAANLTIGF